MKKPDKNIDLKGVQQWMQEALISSGSLNKNAINDHIAASKNLSPEESLAIYQRSYYSRLIQCLKEQYKALCYALGENLFADFSSTYLQKYPSASPTLSHLGAKFPAFLEETRPDANDLEKADWVEFMLDLARYEWDLYKMFDAPGEEGNAYAKENTLDKNLKLQKCFSLNTYRFPVSDYYRAVAQKSNPDIPAPQETFVALSRKNFEIRVLKLLAPQYFFLNQFAQKKSIPLAINDTAENYSKTIDHVREAWEKWKINWLRAGFFIPKKIIPRH